MGTIKDKNEDDLTQQVQTEDSMYQTLIATIDQGFCVIEVLFNEKNEPYDYRFLEKNQVFDEQTGLKDAVGKTMLEMVPTMEKHWFELYGRIALTGEPKRFTEKSEGMHRWFECYGFKIGNKESRKVGVLFTDVTERKKAQDALKESEARFRAIADDAPVFFFLAGENAEVEYLNKTWRKYTGISIEDSKGRAWAEITHPDDIDSATKIYMDGFNRRVSCSFENRQKGTDGIYRTILWKATPRFSASGQFLGMMGVGFDINERAKSEEQLKESEVRFRSLADQSPMIVFLVEPDEKATISYFNKTWLDYSGQTFEQAIGRAWDGIVHPDDVQGVLDIYVPAFLKRESYTLPQVRLRKHTGEYRWHIFKGNPRYLPNGEFIGFVGIGFDIDDRIKVEQALKESEQQFIELAENMPQLAWMADETGWIFWYNQRWFNYTNTTKKQMEGWGWQSVHDPETLPKVLESWKGSIESGMPFEMVFPLKGGDGVFRPFLTRVIPLKDSNGKIIRWFGTNTDITSQKKAEEALRESERRLKQSYDDLETKVTFRNIELERLNKEYKARIEELEIKLKESK